MRHETEFKFIVKRAVRLGSCSRSCLIKAFGTPTATASRIIKSCASHFSDSIVAEGRSYRWLGEIPSWANAKSLLNELESGNDPRLTGIFEHEIPIHHIPTRDNRPRQDQDLFTIMRAIKEKRGVRLSVINLVKAEGLIERNILPISLERFGDQWRIIGLDLNEESQAIESFPLSRIFSVIGTIDAPKSFKSINSQLIYEYSGKHVALSADLSAEQEELIRKELCVVEDKVFLPIHAHDDFVARYSNVDPSEDLIWPLIHFHKKDREI